MGRDPSRLPGTAPVLLTMATRCTAMFRENLAAAGIETVRLPPKSPNLNAFAERFVRTITKSCLDGLILSVKPHCDELFASSWGVITMPRFRHITHVRAGRVDPITGHYALDSNRAASSSSLPVDGRRPIEDDDQRLYAARF
jgi:hypothetical protein